MKDKIEFSEFLEIEKKLEIRIGEIIEVEKLPKSNKMLKFVVDFGNDEKRTVVSNIGKGMSEEEAKEAYDNYVCPFITNLQPATIMGIESEAMIMIPNVDGELCHLEVELGASIL